MDPVISVVIPTYNRADLLPRVLRSLVRQTLDYDVYEVIVVDNNSNDATRETVERFARKRGDASAAGDGDRGPVVRYVFEGLQGLSRAKNTGLSAARGKFVAYTDDDVVPSPDWLRSILEDFQEIRPKPDVVGGPSFPYFMGHKPTWYREAHEKYTWGESARFLRQGEVFFGLNVAFRRGCLVRAGGFETSLGMIGDMLGGGEDCEVFGRLASGADRRVLAYYDPRAFVTHLIPDSRTNPAYRIRRGFVLGQARYRMDRLSRRNMPGALAYQGLGLVGHLVLAGIALPVESHAGNWLICWGERMAARFGYFAAAAGVLPCFTRD